MARPTSINTEEILEAARRCFLEDGYGASTAQIAKAAGISEGSIFKRFSTKEELFYACMGLPELDDSLIEGRAGKGEIEAQLAAISVGLIDFFREMIPRVLATTGHSHFLEHFKQHAEPPPLRILKLITGYLEQEAKLGRIENGDPNVLARILIGAMHNYVFFEYIGIQSHAPLDVDEYVRGVVGTLCHGILPEGA